MLQLRLLKSIINRPLLWILLAATILRFAGLNWAMPYRPHPDEWNMANAITRLNPKDQLNPHFFAYGQFPLYLSYFSASIYNQIPWINKPTIDTNEATFFLRFYSALASVITVVFIYLIAGKLLNKQFAVVASVLAVFSPGMIQNAHFGTTEALLTLFFTVIICLSLKLHDNFDIKTILLAGIVLGMAVGSKLSGLAFGLPVFVVFVLEAIKSVREKKFRHLFYIPILGLFFLGIVSISAIIFSPHLVVSFKDSRSTLRYEATVATGDSRVFYTRQYLKTTPVVFQLIKVFPYTNGLTVLLFGLIGLVLSLVAVINPKGMKKKRAYWFILIVSFLGYFLSQAFLFAKWTRFMAPVFPFFPILALFVWSLLKKEIKNTKLFRMLFTAYCFLAIIPAIYFSSIYFIPDIRFIASEWIYKNIPSGSAILFDTGNVMDIPALPPTYNYKPPTTNYQTTSFDFYGLDENKDLYPKLLDKLVEADYIFVPSRRIFSNHMRFPEQFPLTNRYYELLFSGDLGFTPIKTFCPLPQLMPAGFNCFPTDEQAEETWSVFDHPVIRIYEKVNRLSKEQYQRLFEQSI